MPIAINLMNSAAHTAICKKTATSDACRRSDKQCDLTWSNDFSLETAYLKLQKFSSVKNF